MRFLVSTVSTAMLLTVCADAHAGQLIRRQSCEVMKQRCEARSDRTPAQCKILYDAAIKSGGQWAMPEAMAAAKLPAGGGSNCFP